MEPSLSSMLLLFLAAPLAYGASTSSSTSKASASSTASLKASSTASSTDDGKDHVTVTSVVTGPSGPTTHTETFVPTTYSQFKEASSTVTTKTIVTVQLGGMSSSISTYSYEIGPGGVGWRLPSFSNGALPPLPLPTYLPGETPSSASSSRISLTASSTSRTSSASVTSSRSGSSSNRSSTKSASTDSTSSTTRRADSTSSQTSSQASSSTFSKSLPQNSSTSTNRPNPGSTTSSSRSSSQSSSASSSKITSSDTTSSSSLRSTSESKSGPTSRGSSTSSPKASSTGPTITSSTAILTATITQAPTGFSAEIVSGTTYPSNTWITTKDKDDHTTILPVIIFGGGPPIIMWGVPPTPNVQFSFPKLPKFHLPCIKVFGVSVGSCTTDPVTDGPPGDEDNPDDPTKSDKTSEKASTTKKASTTDECTSTSTVSACEVRCAKTTSSNSCASYTTTCSATKTGCSVTGSTTTITSSTSACSTCGSCMARGPAGKGGPPEPTTPPTRPDDEEEGDSDNNRKRDHPRHLQKRAGVASQVNALGACALTSGTVTRLTRPAWPRATADILDPDSQGKLNQRWAGMTRYDRATGTGPCGTVPTVTRLDAAGWKAANNYQALDGTTKTDNDRLSLDHAYEKSWIKDFLASIPGTSTGGGKLACADVNTFFFPQATPPQTCQWSLLQPVWNSIASTSNPQYFIAMSQYVNSDGKGAFFVDPVKTLPQNYINDPKWKVVNDGKWHWATGNTATSTSAIDTLKKMRNKGFEPTLLGCVEMKMNPMRELMQKTNNRIYDELLLLDQRVKSPANAALFGASNVPKWTTAFGSNGIAGAYKDYMTKNIEPQIKAPPVYMTKLWNFWKDQLAEAEKLPDVKVDGKDNTKPGKYLPEWQQLKDFADNVDTVYKTNSGGYDWEYTFDFSWDRNHKRDEGDAEEGGGESDRKIELTCSGNSASESASSTSESGSSSSSSASKTFSGSSSSSRTTMSTSSSASSATASKTNSRRSSSTNSQRSSIKTTSSTKSSASSSSASKTSSSSSTTQAAPRVTAPSVTVGTSTEKVDKCEQGYGSYSMLAKATAPANAKSQRFYVPRADAISGGMDWSIEFVDGFVGDDPKEFDKNKPTDPKTVVASWSVGTSEGKDPVAKGKGGKDMKIAWKSPDKANGTFVELVYVDPVGQQEWGIIAKGGKAACMPDSCNGPPRVVSDDNGKVCKKWPCSTQIVCSDDGPVTPRADCLLVEDGVLVPMWYEVSIAANNFIEDGGAQLKREEKGCGALTAWKKHDVNVRSQDGGSWTAVQEYTFTLPVAISSGCVERAIASAGGPKDLRCRRGTSDWDL